MFVFQTILSKGHRAFDNAINCRAAGWGGKCEIFFRRETERKLKGTIKKTCLNLLPTTANLGKSLFVWVCGRDWVLLSALHDQCAYKQHKACVVLRMNCLSHQMSFTVIAYSSNTHEKSAWWCNMLVFTLLNLFVQCIIATYVYGGSLSSQAEKLQNQSVVILLFLRKTLCSGNILDWYILLLIFHLFIFKAKVPAHLGFQF